jgi:hypothetical protein
LPAAIIPQLAIRNPQWCVMDDRQLKWVQKARTLRERAGVVGPVASEFVKSLGRGGPAWRQKLIGILYDEIGPELMDHVEPYSLSRGILTFRVEQPAMAYHLRMQWEQTLLQMLNARLPQAGINSIRFSTARGNDPR